MLRHDRGLPVTSVRSVQPNGHVRLLTTDVARGKDQEHDESDQNPDTGENADDVSAAVFYGPHHDPEGHECSVRLIPRMQRDPIRLIRLIDPSCHFLTAGTPSVIHPVAGADFK